MVFDLLELDGEDLTKLPYDERRDRLEQHVRERGPIQVPPAFEGDIAAALKTTRELGLEGVRRQAPRQHLRGRAAARVPGSRSSTSAPRRS